jgi:hypothetical protein
MRARIRRADLSCDSVTELVGRKPNQRPGIVSTPYVKFSLEIQDFVAGRAVHLSKKPDAHDRMADVQVSNRDFRKPGWQFRID